MRTIKSTFAALAVILVTLPAHAGIPPLEGSNGTPSLAPLLEKVTPGVVNIAVTGKSPSRQNPLFQDPFFRHFFDAPNMPKAEPQMSVGSGVIVDSRKGYVLTNNHVINDAERIVVTLKDRRTFKAKLVGTDPATDIALLKIDPDHLQAVAIGDSDGMKVGDYVVAIGNPFGLGQTVTSGIVSALGRSGLNIEGYEDFIQTDASINPGNSGGALVNLKGELIGVNTAIIGPSGGNVGIGFAVPANMAKSVMQQLADHGEVRRGHLGVMVQDLTPDIANAMDIKRGRGAVVTRVDKDSPAERAGLKAGDVIVGLDGRDIRGSSDLRNRVGLMQAGTKVSLSLIRDNAKKTVTAEIEKLKTASITGDKAVPQLAGAVFRDIVPGMDQYGKEEGVLVANVDQGSPAWAYGLRPDDVVVAVNRKPVKSVEQLMADAKESKHAIALNVDRGDTSMFIVIQ